MVVASRNGISALFSPIPSSQKILSESLGKEFKVDYLIAPTANHDTFFAGVAEEFPQAVCLTSPLLRFREALFARSRYKRISLQSGRGPLNPSPSKEC